MQQLFCRSRPWRTIAGKGVLPWSLHGFEPAGDVLEVGAGGGAMAAELLRVKPAIRMTVTDFDDGMVELATDRLREFADRAVVRQADATQLPFGDGSFDVVLSWVMLHHTLEWEKALAECVRVLRPGGHLVGYDLLATAPLRIMHRGDDRLRLMHLDELKATIAGLPVDETIITPSIGGTVVRFRLRKTA